MLKASSRALEGRWEMRQGTELEGCAAAGAAAGPVSVAGTRRTPAGVEGWLCWGFLKIGTGFGQVLSNFLPFRALLGEWRLHSAQPLCWGRGAIIFPGDNPCLDADGSITPMHLGAAQLFMYRKKPFVKNGLFIKQNNFLPKGGAQNLSLSYAFGTNYCLRLKMIGREN